MNPTGLRTSYNMKLGMNGHNRFPSKQSAEELEQKARRNPNFDIETVNVDERATDRVENQSHLMLSKSKPMTEVGNFDLTTLNSSNQH